MNTWTIINGDTLCLNGRPVAKIFSTQRDPESRSPISRPNYLEYTKDERRELLEELNRKDR